MFDTVPLRLENISKFYPGVIALNEVDFSIEAGEVRALLGKNGAGKSTLIRMACGLEKPDKGTIYINGERVEFRGPADARNYGIEIVSQELNLVPWMDVAENISIGRWPKRIGGIDYKAMRQLAVEALARLDVQIDPTLPVSRLSPAQQQLVEIAKALAKQPSVLLLDEPTSSLPVTEVESLLNTVKRIASQGVAVIYVSHRLAEIAQVADSVTVLRNGNLVGTASFADLTEQDIVNQMVGGVVELPELQHPDFFGVPVVLHVDDLTIPDRVENVSFELHEGEVLGLAGLLGTGRSEILRTIAGFDKPEHGEIKLLSGEAHRSNIQYMIAHGIALTPENRREEGIIPYLGVDENLATGRWGQLAKNGIISWQGIKNVAEQFIEQLSIKTPKVDTPVMNLSGGNQQKVVIGRWLGVADRVLLMDEPTRGVDVEAKSQIYEIIRSTAARGVGIIVVTSELEELLWCCDSIIFLHNGKASQKYKRADLNIETLNSLVNGGTL
ncbi:MAG: sugar ABC transporter ATP-binding protein [Anaerolineaceae bacterium]|nr:sugar ABC transporter ATP-binding protein [Anaerolineaceae bacterium]